MSRVLRSEMADFLGLRWVALAPLRHACDTGYAPLRPVSRAGRASRPSCRARCDMEKGRENAPPLAVFTCEPRARRRAGSAHKRGLASRELGVVVLQRREQMPVHVKGHLD